MLIGKLVRKLIVWHDIMGETPFKVANSLLGSSKHAGNALYELLTLQSLLAMRVNISDSFGEFRIPDELAGLFAGDSYATSVDGAGLFEESEI